MVVWWLCWHRTILMKNIWQKQYSQFPPVHDLRKPWWGVAYVQCVINLQVLYAWVIRWHLWPICCHWLNIGMNSFIYPYDTWFICSTLQELAVTNLGGNLGQLRFCLSIIWSRCCNTYRESCIQQRKTTCLHSIWKSFACARAWKLTSITWFRCCNTGICESWLLLRNDI